MTQSFTAITRRSPKAPAGKQCPFWVEVQLVDEANVAVAGIPWTLESHHPHDGQIDEFTHTGVSDSRGLIRVDMPHGLPLRLKLAAQPLADEMEKRALHDAALAAQALVCDIRAQKVLLDERLKQLQSAVLLASAPRGVALTSGEHVQLTARQNVMVNAGQHLDLGAMNNISLAAEASLGLFAHKDGMKLIAGQGDVEIRAQHNTMALSAEKQVTITSTDDEIIISTPKTLTLNGGGSYLKLSENGIEHGSEGNMIMKVAKYLVPGSGASLSADTSEFGVSALEEVNPVDSKSFHD